MVEWVLSVVTEHLPELLVALAIAAVQALWAACLDLGRSRRIQKLRERVVKINEFITSESALEPTPDELAAVAAAKDDRARLLAALAEIARRAARRSRPAEELSPFRRSFLLYRPSSIAGWVMHALFFFALAAAAIMAGVHIAGIDPSVTWGTSLFWAGLAITFWEIASSLEKTRTARLNQREPWIRRTALFYWPAGATARFLHILFWMIAAYVGLGVVAGAVLWARGDLTRDQVLAGALALALVGVFATALNLLARKLDIDTGRA